MDGIYFWTVAGAMALGITALMVLALVRGRAGLSAAVQDLGVYRDQLREVERDLARGVIAEDEAARLRTEIGRRVLAADQATRTTTTTERGPRPVLVSGLVAVLVFGVGFGIYVLRGQPGVGDMSMASRLADSEALRASRPPQAEVEAQVATARPPVPVPTDPRHAELMQQLRKAMVERPNDLQGHELLARNEAMLGNYADAARAQARVVALKGPSATADDLVLQAELMISATNGYVSPEAEAVLAAALEKDRSNAPARYYSGLMFVQIGRADLAFRFWAPLWEASKPTDPWVPPLQTQLPEIAFLAGQHRYTLPPLQGAMRGPDAAAMAAAADMTPEARQQMIRGMVDGLLERLATEGGSAPEWARAIRALGVLGDTDRARAILSEAQTRFAGRTAELAEIGAAAQEAGLQ